jgi:hypothetical protein
MLNIITITGPAASGKTYTALAMASMFSRFRVKRLNFNNLTGQEINFMCYAGPERYYDLIILDECRKSKKLEGIVSRMITNYDPFVKDLLSGDHCDPKVFRLNTNVLILSQDRLNINPWVEHISEENQRYLSVSVSEIILKNSIKL